MRAVRVRAFAVSLGLALSSFGAALVAAEVLLRGFDYAYSPVRIEIRGAASDWRFHHSFRDGNFHFDPVLIWRPRAGRGVFNPQGYRRRAAAGGSGPAGLRILALGDSNTLGWSQPEGPNWPGYLEEILAQEGWPAAVINAGVWGYSSFQGLARFHEMLPLNPHLVLVSFGSNEAHRVGVSDAKYVETLQARLLPPGLYRTRLGQLVAATGDRLLAPPHPPAGELVFRVAPGEYREHLREMAEVSRTRGIPTVLITRPYLGHSRDETSWKRFAPEYRAVTLELGRELGVPVIDFYEQFRDTPDDFRDESHFNERGHRRAARIVAGVVEALPELGNGPYFRPASSPVR